MLAGTSDSESGWTRLIIGWDFRYLEVKECNTKGTIRNI